MSNQYYYRIQDLVTGKFYSGSKYGKDADPNTFWKPGGYFTSSKIIADLIKESGTERFRVVKLHPCKDAHDFETRFLRKIDAQNHPLFYNGHNNTWPLFIGHTEESKQKIRKARLGTKRSEETKQKMRKPKSEEHRKNNGLARLGKKQPEETAAKRRGQKRSEESLAKMRKPRSEEAKKKSSEALKGVPKSEEHKMNMRKPKSEEHKRKMSELRKGVPWSEETRKKRELKSYNESKEASK